MSENEKFYTVRGYQLLQQNKRHLTSAMEDYLEMIYRNSGEQGYIRINTLSELLNVKPSSTTKMVQRLSKLDMVNYEKYGIVVLTNQGKEIGKFLISRHEIIELFFKQLGIKSSLKQVELIEHDISVDTLENINLLNMFFKEGDILRNFREFQKNYFKKIEQP